MDYKKILLKLLGLSDDAADDAITAAADAMPGAMKQTETELATVKNRLQVLETETLTTEAKAFVAKHADVIKDPAKIENAYVQNKASTIALIEAIKPANEQKKPLIVLNRGGSTPAANEQVDSRDLAAKQRKAIATVKNREKCNNERAFVIAQEEHPELFPASV